MHLVILVNQKETKLVNCRQSKLVKRKERNFVDWKGTNSNTVIRLVLLRRGGRNWKGGVVTPPHLDWLRCNGTVPKMMITPGAIGDDDITQVMMISPVAIGDWKIYGVHHEREKKKRKTILVFLDPPHHFFQISQNE